MGISSGRAGPGVTQVTIDFPPVNAPPVQGWFDLARTIMAAGDDPATHVVILRAEGRGFCAGVDIKEMQRTEGHHALIGANRGCAAAKQATMWVSSCEKWDETCSKETCVLEPHRSWSKTDPNAWRSSC